MVSFRLLLRVLPKLLIDFSLRVGIFVPATENLYLSVTLPLLITSDLDLAGLNCILAHSIFLSRPFKSYLPPVTDFIVTVRSSMYALIGGCSTPDSD